MKTMHVRIKGCDDSTEFDLDVTTEQEEFLKMLAAKSVATSEYDCQPIIVLHEEEKQKT